MNGWSAVLLGGASFVLCITTLLGWRAGVVRQLVSIAALALAAFIAFSGGRLVAPLLQAMGIAPRWMLIGSIALALLVYGTITLLSWLLLKKTHHQEVGLVRLGYGFFGALIGFLKGLLVIWVGAVGIRFAGEITALQSELAQRNAATPQQLNAAAPSASGEALAEMSHALDHGLVSGALDLLDPVPAPLRQNAPRLMRVLADERAMSRFRTYPGVRELVNHPKLIELGMNREFQRAAAAGDLLALAQQPRMHAVLADEQILATLRKIELEKALDHALGGRSVPTERQRLRR